MSDLWDEIVGIPVCRFAGARSVRELQHYIDIRDGKASPSARCVPNDGNVLVNPDVLRRCLSMLLQDHQLVAGNPDKDGGK